MSKLFHVAAAGAFLVFAAASLIGLATAAPETAETAPCEKALCLVAFF